MKKLCILTLAGSLMLGTLAYTEVDTVKLYNDEETLAEDVNKSILNAQQMIQDGLVTSDDLEANLKSEVGQWDMYWSAASSDARLCFAGEKYACEPASKSMDKARKVLNEINAKLAKMKLKEVKNEEVSPQSAPANN